MDNNKPNLLLIMCDQLRADVLDCYGDNFVKTPNIDKLAERGICFKRAYSQTPVCVPARYGLISGKAPYEVGMVENTTQTPENFVPLPKLLRKSGYFTCAVGKMHFHPVREHYGFDRMFLSEEVPSHIQDDDYLQYLYKKGYGHVLEPHGKRSEFYYVPQISKLPEEMHTSSWTADKTCEVIRKNRNRPFFIFSSFIKPHPPFDPCIPYDSMYNPEEVPNAIRTETELSPDDISIYIQNDYKVNGIENVTDEQMKKMRAYYYGSITQLDKQIGKILDTLDEHGLTENTMIIFTSDHGEMLGDHYSFGKRSFYEQSTQVPLIVSYTGVIPQNQTRDQFAVLHDIYTTFVNAAGGEVPKDSDGVDLIPVCMNNNTTRNEVVGVYGKERNMKFMLRWDDYKYIYYANGGINTLFNLNQDPYELSNIKAINEDLCTECRNRLEEYFKDKGLFEFLDNGNLIRYEYKKPEQKGYINQRPKWPEFLTE